MQSVLNSLKVVMILISLVLLNGTLHAQDDNVKKSDKNDRILSTNDDFTPEAKRLSVDLMQQVGFSLEKAVSVREILLDYNKDIMEARNEHNEALKDNNSDVVGSDNSADIEGILGYDVGVYYKDTSPDLMKVYKEADKKANDEIVSLLTDDQVNNYEKVKGKWWKEVKDAVFSPYHDKNQGKFDKKQ